ncbi:uncharacterized protein [Physcomitrium patens]|uniref:uncharacterized protein isoform X2 n=1 Tax=Physcomitrium patens TaxID=3218 RepID=UPI000D15AA1E|nr:uncharacterized protein LOC112288915 isoform X2 [Physcomitrium patens]|eukprot:XP_024389423.1 uncharacterized protein LOC112288915 isoform X2 [Physcomitrella patens]
MPIPSHSSFVKLLLARNISPPTGDSSYISSLVPNSACARSCGSAVIESVTVQELESENKSVDMHKHTSHTNSRRMGLHNFKAAPAACEMRKLTESEIPKFWLMEMVHVWFQTRTRRLKLLPRKTTTTGHDPSVL